MEHSSGMTVRKGFPEDQRETSTKLFWLAFKGKIGPLLRPEVKAVDFLKNVSNPGYVLCAVNADGAVLGIAGFKTSEGAFIGGTLSDLQNTYGWIGGLWRGLLLGLLERDLKPGVLLMDGIVVSAEARGQGIGTLLLQAIKDEALARKCASVRLDVIDTNPRAKALYERLGFVAGPVSDIGPLRHLFGFRTSTQMICTLTPQNMD